MQVHLVNALLRKKHKTENQLNIVFIYSLTSSQLVPQVQVEIIISPEPISILAGPGLRTLLRTELFVARFSYFPKQVAAETFHQVQVGKSVPF